MQLAIKTRGYNRDYEWDASPGVPVRSYESMGAVISESAPGLLIKRENGRFDMLLVCINTSRKDSNGRSIKVKVFIGGLDEQKVRGIAVYALQDWAKLEKLTEAITEISTMEAGKREWNVEWKKLEEFIDDIPDAGRTATKFTDARQDDKLANQLADELQRFSFSDGDGYKIYFGESANSADYEKQMQRECDRFYWRGSERINLTEKQKTKKGDDAMNDKTLKNVVWGMTAVVILLIGLVGWGGLQVLALKKQNVQVENSLKKLQKENEELKQQNEGLKKQLLTPIKGM